MGTNYYLIENKESTACPTGGHVEEPWRYHIGKSSAGWCFAVHVDKDEGINSLADLLPKFSDSRYIILDEYGDTISAGEMEYIITKRHNPKAQITDEILRYNHAVRGPHGLLRANHQYCIGHGEGTWDYFEGEFS
jgi:hypothetical protein